MISFLKLIRYKNLLMVLLTMVLTKYALIESFVPPSFLRHFQFIILAISVICITAGGYIINDIFDIEADKINKPNKVFIDVTISKKNAWRSYFLLSFLGLFLGGLLAFKANSLILFLIFLFSTQGLFIYSSLLKKKPLIGNLTISFFISIVFGLVYIFSSYQTKPSNSIWEAIEDSFAHSLIVFFIITYILFSFLTTLIREIIKDIEDINGDLKINAKTLPIVIGRKRANRVALGFSVLLLLFLIVLIREFIIEEPVFLGYSIVFLLIPIGYFIYKLYDAKTKKDYSYLSKLMKLIMFFGILSMLLFKLI